MVDTIPVAQLQKKVEEAAADARRRQKTRERESCTMALQDVSREKKGLHKAKQRSPSKVARRTDGNAERCYSFEESWTCNKPKNTWSRNEEDICSFSIGKQKTLMADWWKLEGWWDQYEHPSQFSTGKNVYQRGQCKTYFLNWYDCSRHENGLMGNCGTCYSRRLFRIQQPCGNCSGDVSFPKVPSGLEPSGDCDVKTPNHLLSIEDYLSKLEYMSIKLYLFKYHNHKKAQRKAAGPTLSCRSSLILLLDTPPRYEKDIELAIRKLRCHVGPGE